MDVENKVLDVENEAENKDEIKKEEILGKIHEKKYSKVDIRTVLRDIKVIALDVDGVLTRGGIYIGETGETQKRFDAKDGMGITCALRQGLGVSIVTGRKSFIVTRRASELGITDVRSGVVDKGAELEKIAKKFEVEEKNIAYMGDDLNDLPILARAGFSSAPFDAAVEVRERVDYVACKKGGEGAVREVIELILKSQGKWNGIIAAYLFKGQGDKQ